MVSSHVQIIKEEDEMRVLTKEEYQLWCKFKIVGGSNLQRKKVSEIKLSAANTWEHEEKKLKMAYECLKNKEPFLMEADEIKTGRIRDFVNLKQRIAYEFERDKRRYELKKQEGAYESPNCIVEVIKIW